VRHSTLFLLLAAVSSGCSSELASQAVEPKIDMHMHARTSAIRTAAGDPVPIPCIPEGCEPRSTIVRSDEDVMGLAIESMTRNNIVLGMVTDANLNDVYEWVEADPDRFWAGPAIFNPAAADTAFLRTEFEAKRLQVMGEIAAQYQGYAPNDPALEPFFALAEALDVPLLIHCEGVAGASRQFQLSDGDPRLLQEVLERHPDLRLWIENAGYPYLEGIIALMYRYPQVYADISTITWIIPRMEFWRYLQALMDAGLGKRLMWGSDQMNWPGTIDLAIEAIEEAPFLSEDEKRDLFHNNAASFLRLSSTPGG